MLLSFSNVSVHLSENKSWNPSSVLAVFQLDPEVIAFNNSLIYIINILQIDLGSLTAFTGLEWTFCVMRHSVQTEIVILSLFKLIFM